MEMWVGGIGAHIANSRISISLEFPVVEFCLIDDRLELWLNQLKTIDKAFKELAAYCDRK